MSSSPTTETVSSPAKEAAQALLRSGNVDFFAQAAADGYGHVTPQTHVLALVGYHTGAWEVGLVPKKVEYDAVSGVYSHGIYVYRDDTGHFRGPCICSLLNGDWYYMPD